MANQHTTSHSRKPVVRAILVALALVILVGILDAPSHQLCNFLSAAGEHTLVLLPSFALTALQPDASNHQHISLCSFEMLVFWPLLQTAAKAA